MSTKTIRKGAVPNRDEKIAEFLKRLLEEEAGAEALEERTCSHA